MSDRRDAVTVPSLALGVRIVDMVASASEPLTLTDVVQRLGIAKSTAHRHLATLVQEQVLVRRGVDRTFALAPRWSSLGEANGRRDLVRTFFDIAEPLAREVEETFQLGVPAGKYVTFVAYVDSPRPVRLACHVGRQLPLHASATGKALLAYLPENTLGVVIADGLTRLTARTVIDPDQLRAEVAQVRVQGYATESEESTRSLSCIAAPVLDRHRRAVAAVTACIPTPDLTPDTLRRLAPRVVAAADHLGEATTR